VSDIIQSWLEDVVYQLRNIFEGSRTEFSLTLIRKEQIFNKGLGKRYSKYLMVKTFPTLEFGPKP